MDNVRLKSGVIHAKVRKSRHKRLRKTVFLKAKKEIASKHFHQSSLFALCLYSVACDVPPGKFMFLCLSVFYKSPCKICPSVFLSLKSHPAKYVFMFFMSSTTHFANHVLMSFCLLKTHLAPHVFQSPFLAFLSNKKSVKRLIINSLTLYYVVLRGLEPRLREPKTLVLPLHHRTNMSNHTVTIAGAKVVDFLSTTKLFALFIARKRRLCLFFCAFT